MNNLFNPMRLIEHKRFPLSRPVPNSVKIPTCMHDPRRRHDFLVLRIPSVRNRRNVARAHDALSKHLDAVVDVSC
jgi:hypothetical protein